MRAMTHRLIGVPVGRVGRRPWRTYAQRRTWDSGKQSAELQSDRVGTRFVARAPKRWLRASALEPASCVQGLLLLLLLLLHS